MGLDITAYSNLRLVGRHTDGCCEDEDHVLAYAYDAFPASLRGIPELVRRDGLLEGGCFETTSTTETHRFRAGSYGGYNVWRDALADRFNPEPSANLPFYELIWFADNEGTISADAAKDLHQDFQKFAHWLELKRDPVYADFMHACELASHSGLIRFH
jgi:hypothetical protein